MDKFTSSPLPDVQLTDHIREILEGSKTFRDEYKWRRDDLTEQERATLMVFFSRLQVKMGTFCAAMKNTLTDIDRKTDGIYEATVRKQYNSVAKQKAAFREQLGSMSEEAATAFVEECRAEVAEKRRRESQTCRECDNDAAPGSELCAKHAKKQKKELDLLAALQKKHG